VIRAEVHHKLIDLDRRSVGRLLQDVERHTGQRPLSDQLWFDFVHGDRPAVIAVLAHDDSDLVGYCQVSPSHGSWTIEMVLAPSLDHDQRTRVDRRLLTAALDEVGATGGGRVRWWVAGGDLDRGDLATSVGMHAERTLLEMRVDVPLPAPNDVSPVPTRTFRPGLDEQSWLEVNNAAFHWHPEQGGWDLTTLGQRMRETWFDPDGFLLHDRDGRLAAFCWTKIHHEVAPPVGEIYVIAVHPDFHGLGLGRALTVAGLASIAARGVTTALLYVDADNAPAVGLYGELGFVVRNFNQTFVLDVDRLAVAPTTETAAAEPGGPR
jgi:mycothiol synthase